MIETEHKSPLVSIALCTYNGEKYIAHQLDSILSQSYEAIEIVIVDDCSTDQTLSILIDYQQRDARIKLYRNEENIGFNSNFAKCLTLCRGDFVAIADQDDIWYSHKVATLLANIKNNLLIYHNSAYIDENDVLTGKTVKSYHHFVNGNCAINLIYFNCVSGHACLINKELIKIVGTIPANFYYDWWLAYTAGCLGRMDYVDEILVNHRLHQESSTANDKTEPKKLRIQQLEHFIACNTTPEDLKNLLQKLLKEYLSKKQLAFSFKLFLLLFQNSHELLYIRKKSFYSKLKFLLNESR
ncbi:glycosyltransferase [Pedobacter sp. UC225_65]|uniref:glycosyltransferase n=1 Tax=Pedobacter sp. UC225_65 TaxID=3350173 RepID=UPI0036701D39